MAEYVGDTIVSRVGVKGLDQLRQAELYCSSCKDRNVLNLMLNLMLRLHN